MVGGQKLYIRILNTTDYTEVILSNYIFNDYINSNIVCLFGENSPTKSFNTCIGFSTRKWTLQNFAKITKVLSQNKAQWRKHNKNIFLGSAKVWLWLEYFLKSPCQRLVLSAAASFNKVWWLEETLRED